MPNYVVQGAIVVSGKRFKLIFWKNHWYYWNKQYLSRKPLISALIWHPKRGRGIIMRLPRPPALKGVKNPPRPPMLFTTRRCGALLIMPHPFSGCQIKAEIKGFLLTYCLFLYLQCLFQNIEKGWRKIFEKYYFRDFLKMMKITKKKPLVLFNILKEPLLVQKQTIHQRKALGLSYNRSRIPSIIDTYTKPNLVPLKGIWFPANLGLVLTQLTTWDDWRAV
jgi:hypothetical protein